MLGFTHSMILLRDVGQGDLVVAATHGYAGGGAGARVRLGEGVIGVVAERRKMMRMGSIGASMRYLRTVRARMEAAGQLGPAEAAVPLPGLPTRRVSSRSRSRSRTGSSGCCSWRAPGSTLSTSWTRCSCASSGTRRPRPSTTRAPTRSSSSSDASSVSSRPSSPISSPGRRRRSSQDHRREVTVVFLDLRGFTAFAEASDPEEVMGVLHEYHAEMGQLILAHEGTLERFTGDGMMIFFNDPLPVPNPAERAVRMAVAMRDRAAELAARWRRRGYDLDLGIGIAKGFATIGAIGFEGRWDYGAIGTVTNLAARLCGEAKPGQILVAPRVLAEVEDLAEAEALAPLTLKGFARPIAPLNIVRLRDNP